MAMWQTRAVGWWALGTLLASCTVVSGPPSSGLGLSRPCAELAGMAWTAETLQRPDQPAELRTGGLRLTSSQWMAAAPATARTQAVAAHCKVMAEVLPVDPLAPVIQVQVNLPERWLGGAIQVGGGGLNGSVPRNLAILSASGSPVSAAQPPDAPYPINLGYVMFGGDSGHRESDRHWALNGEAWVNFGHAGLKKTRDAAVLVMTAAYGQAPRRSYFMGQSQGGREALEVAQRYPQDYDGIVATAPLIGYGAHVVAKVLLAGHQQGDAWISPEKAKRIGASVLEQCDHLDGLNDGVVSNYLACQQQFDVQRLRCPGGVDLGPGCLSDAQITTVNMMRAPTRFALPLANGWSSFPGYGVGREALGWLNITPRPKAGEIPNLGQPGYTVQFGILKDPKADLLQFSIERHARQIQAASQLIDSTNPDLTAYFARGGRLIVKSNSADYAVNPQTLAQWFDRVRVHSGQASVDAQARFFVLPGAGHSGDGVSESTGQPIASSVDLVGMMLDWVERGVAPPEAPVLRAMQREAPHRITATRPMCRYPQYPAYLGGDAQRAESFRCTDPQPSKERVLLQDGGRSVDVLINGRGPGVVLLPSSLRDSFDFDEVAERIAGQGFKVLRPQPRGMGRSSAPPADMTLSTLAADVALTIERLGDGMPAVVVGHAYGHWVARVAEVNHPNLVRGVVVLGAAARTFPPGMAEALAIASNPSQPEGKRLEALMKSMFAPGNDPRSWLTGWHPPLRQAYRSASQSPPKDAWFAAGKAPILDLQGAQDPWRPPSSSNELKAVMPGRVTVQRIERASHALIAEQPAAVSEAITAWIRGLPAVPVAR